MSIPRTLSLVVVVAAVACGGASNPAALDEASNGAGGGASCQPGQPDPRACDPADTKKTTVCHIPPGNPANEHTICVGNPAVPAHLAHGDHLGSCCAGKDGGAPPPPPPQDLGSSSGPGGDLSHGPIS